MGAQTAGGGQNLAQSLNAIVSSQIQADPSHLVETIKRQFSNSDEYARELVANGFDAGATQITISGGREEVDGRWCDVVRYEDDGHGMGFSDVEHYLTLFDSLKDVTRDSVGRHGIGKLSPWACDNLIRYEVDTRRQGEHSTLVMSSPDSGELSRYASQEPDGTTVSLYFAAEKSRLHALLTNARKVITRYCRYLPCRIVLERPAHDDGGAKQELLNTTPEAEGWEDFGDVAVAGGTVRFFTRYGRGKGLSLYQSRIFFKHYSDIRESLLHTELRFPSSVEVMADSQAFDIPISRNDITHDRVFAAAIKAINDTVLPAVMRALCRRYRARMRGAVPVLEAGLEETILDYLTIDGGFTPALSLPLIPVIPFKMASFDALRAAFFQDGRIRICTYSTTDAQSIAAQSVLVDGKRLQPAARRALHACFSDIETVDFESDVIESPAGSTLNKPLTSTERKLEESLALLTDIDTEIPGVGGAGDGAGGPGMAAGARTATGGNECGADRPDMPDLSFRLAYLARVDGKTPAYGTKFIVRDNAVVLNLFHQDIRTIADIAEKSANLAAHLLLRELLIRDGVKPVRHLSLQDRDMLLYMDAFNRCLECPVESLRAKGDWDFDDEWRTFFGL